MGVSETGGTLSCTGNNDGPKTGIPLLDADSMAHVNFMGTVTVDMGSELGKALLAACGPSEAIQTIRGCTDQIALLWTCLPERARAHALHPSLLPSRTGLSRQGSFRLAAQMLTRLAFPAHPS